jgi:hypothetical protein
LMLTKEGHVSLAADRTIEKAKRGREKCLLF